MKANKRKSLAAGVLLVSFLFLVISVILTARNHPARLSEHLIFAIFTLALMSAVLATFSVHQRAVLRERRPPRAWWIVIGTSVVGIGLTIAWLAAEFR